ncbi:VanZ family protein [Patescibacteria group bacterium]
MKLKQSLRSWLPVLIWSLAIFVVSSMPTVQTTEIYWWDFLLKKTAHVIEYGILFFLCFEAVNNLGFRFRDKKLVISKKNINLAKINWYFPFIFSTLYAASDEYHQSFVPGRHAKVRDIGFDILGMLIVLFLIKRFLEKTVVGKTVKTVNKKI